jgi:hypothetical protein
MKKTFPAPTCLPIPAAEVPVKPQPHYEWQVGLYEPVRYQRQQDFLKAALDYHAAHCLSAEVKGEATHAAD